MNGLEKILNKIVSDAEEYRRTVLDGAKAKAAEITGAYAEKAEEITKKYSAEVEKDTADRLRRAESSAESASRKAMLGAKSRIIDSVFDEALEKLRQMADGGKDGEEQYFNLLTKLALDAVNGKLESEKNVLELYGESENSDSVLELLLSSRDREKFGEKLVFSVREKSGIGERLVLAAESADIDGGIVLRAQDVEISASLSSLVAQAREKLEGEVCKILFG